MDVLKRREGFGVFLCGLLLCLVSCGGSKDGDDLNLSFNLDYKDMSELKAELHDGTSPWKEAYGKLIACADSLLKEKPYKVTDGAVPPTGDVHDFFTIGKYAFPNPNTPDGMPYIRKDGMVNPEARGEKYDLDRYEQTTDRVKTLALAWFYSDDERYAEKAVEFLRVWFLEPQTKMNPHFECAAALPGVHDGMAIGIIFGARLVDLLDFVRLLSLSDSWTDEDDAALQEWFAEYAEWLQTSKFGKEESKAKNNHITWYLAQIAASAAYNGDEELVKEMIDKGRQQIALQIAMNDSIHPDGSMPLELKRNQSFLYSLYGLEGFCALAGCGKVMGYDLWHYETEDGRGMRAAFEFLAPYLSGEKEWPFESLADTDSIMPNAIHIVRQATKQFTTESLLKAQDYLSRYLSNDPYRCLESKNHVRR